LESRPARPSFPESPVFLNRYGQAHSTKTISNGLRRLMRKIGLKGARGRKGPRPYDLRHTFAVHRLTRWYRQGIDLSRRLPWLSVYMGHASILGTETYLTATPELLALRARRFEARYRRRNRFL
jgi:integrase